VPARVAASTAACASASPDTSQRTNRPPSSLASAVPAGLVQVGEHDLAAGLREHAGRSSAEARCAARDQKDVAANLHHCLLGWVRCRSIGGTAAVPVHAVHVFDRLYGAPPGAGETGAVVRIQLGRNGWRRRKKRFIAGNRGGFESDCVT